MSNPSSLLHFFGIGRRFPGVLSFFIQRDSRTVFIAATPHTTSTRPCAQSAHGCHPAGRRRRRVQCESGHWHGQGRRHHQTFGVPVWGVDAMVRAKVVRIRAFSSPHLAWNHAFRHPKALQPGDGVLLAAHAVCDRDKWLPRKPMSALQATPISTMGCSMIGQFGGRMRTVPITSMRALPMQVRHLGDAWELWMWPAVPPG